jgi:branched-chain amino acid transport system permease protein
MSRARSLPTVLAPALLVAITAVVGAFVSRATEIYFINSLVAVCVVVALYVFVGNSGVLSFGHVSFVAVGAWTAGVLSVPVEEKPATMPNLFGFLGDTATGNLVSLALAALAGGVFALVAGLPLMRLSGLAAGIATFAVLGITNNILRYYEKIGPGLNVFSSVPETTDLLQAGGAAIVAIIVAFSYQGSRFGRRLRAARDDAAAARAVGISVYQQRLIAFTLSGALAGLAGGLYVHFLPINADFVYLELTFMTLAMLVIGGMTSLWGAVVGALAVSGLDSLLAEAEGGLGRVDLPSGSRLVVVGFLMAFVLIVRPAGITGGRGFTLAHLRRGRKRRRG